MTSKILTYFVLLLNLTILGSANANRVKREDGLRFYLESILETLEGLGQSIQKIEEKIRVLDRRSEETATTADKIEIVEHRTANIETLLLSMNTKVFEQAETGCSHWSKLETEITSVNENIRAVQRNNENVENLVISTKSEILKKFVHLEEKSDNFEVKWKKHQLNTTAAFANLNRQMNVSMQRLDNLDTVVVSLLNLTQSVEQIRSDVLTRQQRELAENSALALASGQCYNPSGNTLIKDCADIHDCNAEALSGVFNISPIPERPIQALCDLDDGQAWTVIQRRGAPLPASEERVDFFRGWDSYENGFGSPNSDYWLGLRSIHALTRNNDTELLIHMTHWNGTYAWAKYKTFRVGSSLDKYRLYVGEYSGTAGQGDSFKYHNMMAFSTKDQDNDIHDTIHCAATFREGGWWYKNCALANLNGPYGADDPQKRDKITAIVWYTFTMDNDSLKSVRMQIRRRAI